MPRLMINDSFITIQHGQHSEPCNRKKKLRHKGMVGKKCYWVLPGTDFMNLRISLLVWILTTTLVTESQTPRSLTEVASHSPAGKIQFCSSPDPSKGHRDIQMNFTVRDSLTLLIKPNPYLNMCLELPFRQGRA